MTEPAKRGMIGIPVESQIDHRNEGGRRLVTNMAAAAKQLTDAFAGGNMTEPTVSTTDDDPLLIGGNQGSYVVPATLDDLLPVVERIADALEAQVRPTACAEVHVSEGKCVLDQLHVGYHVTGDGRLHWLDDE
jgi:hypothetical protein